jgi:hypothetical protein
MTTHNFDVKSFGAAVKSHCQTKCTDSPVDCNCKFVFFQFMRCFENHHVVAFEELRNSREAIPIHKPIFCEVHPAENMKFFCFSCQVIIYIVHDLSPYFRLVYYI